MGEVILSAKQIKAEALRLGFSACGVAPAEAVNKTVSNAFCHWHSHGMQAGMNYMGNHLEKRLDPRLLVEGTRSIVSVAHNYYPSRFLREDQYQFAWYAYGKDYHDIMKARLTALQEYISAHSPLPLQSRIFCDTAPVLERYWAWRAGLGWIGKNTQLIIPHAGSCFFLGEIFLSAEADEYDQPLKSRCGNCTRCLDACPLFCSIQAVACLILPLSTGKLFRPQKAKKRAIRYMAATNARKPVPGTDFPLPARHRNCNPLTPSCRWKKRTGMH